MKLLEFIFQSGWTFIGTAILLHIVTSFIERLWDIFWIRLNSRKSNYYDKKKIDQHGR